MGRRAYDIENGPFTVFAGALMNPAALGAITARSLAEGVDRAVVIRRLIRQGAAAEGLDLTGAGNHRELEQEAG